MRDGSGSVHPGRLCSAVVMSSSSWRCGSPFADPLAQGPEIVAENAGHLPGIDRQSMIEVMELEGSVLEAQLKLAPFEHRAVLRAEDGEQDLALELGLDGLPLDVEETRER